MLTITEGTCCKAGEQASPVEAVDTALPNSHVRLVVFTSQ